MAGGRIKSLAAATPEALKGDSVCCAGGEREAVRGRGGTGAGVKVRERVRQQDPANTQVVGVQKAGGLWLEETGQVACGQVMRHTNAWPSAQQHPLLPLPFCQLPVLSSAPPPASVVPVGLPIHDLLADKRVST